MEITPKRQQPDMSWQQDVLNAVTLRGSRIDPTASLTWSVDEFGWMTVAFETCPELAWSKRALLDGLESETNEDLFDRCVQHGFFAPWGMGICRACIPNENDRGPTEWLANCSE